MVGPFLNHDPPITPRCWIVRVRHPPLDDFVPHDILAPHPAGAKFIVRGWLDRKRDIDPEEIEWQTPVPVNSDPERSHPPTLAAEEPDRPYEAAIGAAESLRETAHEIDAHPDDFTTKISMYEDGDFQIEVLHTTPPKVTPRERIRWKYLYFVDIAWVETWRLNPDGDSLNRMVEKHLIELD